MGDRYGQHRRRIAVKKTTGASSGPLTRLLIAAVLFAACLLGRVCFPAQTEEYRERLKCMLVGDTDVQAAFLQLGEQLEEGQHTLEAVGDWCTAVFAPDEVTLTENLSGEHES